MTERLQRYFAALLGCAIAATWAAAGFGPALAGLIAAAVAYAAVAVAQHRTLPRSRYGGERAPVAAARRAFRAPAAARGRRPSPTATRPARTHGTRHPVATAEVTGEPDDQAALPAAARYGW